MQRAREILARLERHRESAGVRKTSPNLLPGITMPEAPAEKPEPTPTSAPEHPLVVALRDTDPDSLTPLEALKRLTEWKHLWGTPNEN